MNVAKLAKRGLFLAGVLSISAASAFAQSVGVPYQEGFDSWSEGLVYGQNKPGWTVQADDASSITNIGTVSEPNKVLSLNTEGQTLQLAFDKTDPDTQALGSTIWVDALVKMVISEDDPASIPADVRTALFLNASSNLVIYHGVPVNESGTWGVVATNDATSVELSPDSWYRLTIETYGNENAQFFKYYINGTPVEGAAGVAYSEIPASFDTPASNNGVWFPAARNTGYDAAVEALAFQGTGFVDDIKVDTTSPLSSTWTLNIGAIPSNGSITTNGAAVTVADEYEFDTATPVTLAAVPAAGYSIATFTTNGVAVGASSVVLSGIAVNDEIRVAATFAQQPVAVVDANGDPITGYDSIEDALAAIAVSGGSIKLYDDVEVADWLLITSAVTLDLNGHSISPADAATFPRDAIVAVCRGGTLTINDSSDPSTGIIDSDTVMCAVKMTANNTLDRIDSATYSAANAATLVLNNGTLQGYEYGISGNGNAGRGNTSVTINGGKVLATAARDTAHNVIPVAIYNPQESSTLTINGGYIEGDQGVYVKAGTVNCSVTAGTIVGTGAAGTYTGNNNGAEPTGNAFSIDSAGYPGGTPSASISGGTFVSSNGLAVASYNRPSTAPVDGFVAGGSFNTPVPEEVCATGYIPEDNGDGTYGVKPGAYVAEIVGGAKFESIQAAINAAGNGDKIVVLVNTNLDSRIDVPAGANITLDLGGHTLTRTGDAICNRGSIVITNGTITASGNVAYNRGNGASITVEDGTYTSTADIAFAVYGATNSAITVNGGTITAQEYCVGNYHPAKATTITINGGTLTAIDNAVIGTNGTNGDGDNVITINGGTLNGGITTAGYVACGIYLPNDDTLVVNGGTINVTGGAGIVARAGSVTVNGGTITTTGTVTGKVGDSRVVVPCSAIVFDSQAGYPGYDSANAEVTIAGGTFSSANGEEIAQVMNDGDALAIEIPVDSQARFAHSNADAEVELPAGYELVEDGGYYVIGKATYTLTYVTAQGVAPAAVSYNVDSNDFALAAAPAVEGYNFLGWVIGTTTNAAGAMFDVSENLQDTTATAAWEAQGNLYPNSAKASDIVIVAPGDTQTAEALEFGAPTFDANGVHVSFNGEIIGSGTVASGLYLKVKYVLTGDYATIPASFVLTAGTGDAGEGTATFDLPNDVTQIFFFGVTDTAINNNN